MRSTDASSLPITGGMPHSASGMSRPGTLVAIDVDVEAAAAELRQRDVALDPADAELDVEIDRRGHADQREHADVEVDAVDEEHAWRRSPGLLGRDVSVTDLNVTLPGRMPRSMPLICTS